MVQINSSTYTNNMNKNLRTINSALPVHYKCTLPRNTIVNMPQMSCYFSALINDSILYRASSSFFHDSAITGYEHIHPYEIFHNRKSHHLKNFFEDYAKKESNLRGVFPLNFHVKVILTDEVKVQHYCPNYRLKASYN